ncbi:alpha/beta hydrolase [Candidatus Saccharibacteria bacterium]|nr:alpha/beta hydrolase [Candidatus Saccharibacteria bacterium]
MTKKSSHTLYLIHGWTYTVEPWAQTLALLEKSGVKVNLLRVPGLTSPSQRAWTIEEYLNWADEQIPDGAIALGHSNGGRILLNLCAERPDKLKHLILLSSAGVYEPSKKRSVLRAISKLASPLKRLPLLRKAYHKLIGASDYSRAPENMKATLAHLLDSDRSLDLSKVSTPASILWGEEDTITPPRQARKLHASLKHSTLEFFPGWNHAPYINHPDELAAAILKVLDKVDA